MENKKSKKIRTIFEMNYELIECPVDDGIRRNDKAPARASCKNESVSGPDRSVRWTRERRRLRPGLRHLLPNSECVYFMVYSYFICDCNKISLVLRDRGLPTMS